MQLHIRNNFELKDVFLYDTFSSKCILLSTLFAIFLDSHEARLYLGSNLDTALFLESVTEIIILGLHFQRLL